MLMTDAALKQFQVNKEWAAGVGVNIALANSGGCVLIKKVSPLTLLSFEAFHSMEEVMNSINWTKFYDLYVQNEHFKVFIVKDDTNCFHAGCLWYEVERVLRVQGEPGNFRIAFETRADTNEQAALDQLKAWVTSKFGKDFKLVPSK